MMEVGLFAFSLWLGLYLIVRGLGKPYLQLAGLGLISYALALLSVNLQIVSQAETIPLLENLHTFLIFQPALLWAGGLLYLLPEKSSANNLLLFWKFGQVLTTEVLILVKIFSGFPTWALGAITGLPLFVYLVILSVEKRKAQDKIPFTLALVGTIFFGLSTGLLIPIDAIPRIWVAMILGFDLELLGVGIAIYDAFDEGHDLRKDMLYSLQNAFFVALLFGIQIVLVIVLSTGLNFAMLLLLYASIASAIVLSTLVPILQRRFQGGETAKLHAAADSLSRIKHDHEFSEISEVDFTRYTRRAISYLDNLPRLAASPLTQLPLIEQRLQNKQLTIDTLSRTNMLKTLLIESIERLKPQTEERFGSTDEWRYYNALYFPYVAGIKPSRRRQARTGLKPHEAAALDWFQVEVPERTLHNWQNAAAKLVAQDLQEQLARIDE